MTRSASRASNASMSGSPAISRARCAYSGESHASSHSRTAAATWARSRRSSADQPGRCRLADIRSRRSGPDEALRRVVHDPRDIREHARAQLAVHEAVVEAQRELGDPADRQLALVDPRHLADGAEGEDRRLARVEDRGAGVDAERTDVRDGDGAVAELLRREATLARGDGDGLQLLGERPEREAV